MKLQKPPNRENPTRKEKGPEVFAAFNSIRSLVPSISKDDEVGLLGIIADVTGILLHLIPRCDGSHV